MITALGYWYGLELGILFLPMRCFEHGAVIRLDLPIGVVTLGFQRLLFCAAYKMQTLRLSQ